MRVSEDRTGDELGVTRQRQDARQLAKLRGWTIVAEHADNDLSAAGRRVRPGFEAVLSSMSSGQAGAVIAWDMTRLSRNRRDLQRLIEAGQKHGTCIAFVRGSDVDLSTPAGRLIVDVLGGVARHEIDQKSDRQRRAAVQAAEQGRRIGGRRPFGYEADGITVRKVEAAALVTAYDAVLCGVPLARIARELTAAGLHTPQPARNGGPSRWIAQTLRSMLLNPRYAGLRSHTTAELRESLHPTRARIKGIVGPAQWPSIVTEETWRAAVEVLMNPDRANPARVGRALLTGVALCGVDGCTATVHRGVNPLGQPIYRCSTRTGHVNRQAEPVDDFVGKAVVARLSAPDAADLLVDHDRPDAGALRREARALRVRLDSLATMLADGTLTDVGVRRASRDLRHRLAEVEAQQLDAGRADVLGPLIGAKDLQATWLALDTDRRRMIVDVLFTVRLLPPGRGTRTFRRETVQIEPRLSTRVEQARGVA